MTLNTTEVLDLSKENVQPLRQGRKAAHLKTALQAQTDPETQYRLQKQREKYEYMIRMYEGDDPLEPYCNYVAWIEQSFTKVSRESNLVPLLEDALLKFKDCDKYKQDPRFVQLLVKYINVQSNPLELYQLAYNQGLGTMCSALYKAWAEELDKSNDFKRADNIYQLGIHCRAQPLRELEEAHVQFQLSIARRMLEGNIMNSDQGNENTRSALSKLQPSKVKSSRISKDTAGVFQLTTRNSDSKNNAVSVGKFKVYQEDDCDGFVKADTKNKNEKLPKASVADRENIMKPAKWCGQKQKQSSVFRSSMPTTPSFQIHEDPDAGCENLKTVIRPRALKIRREEFRCPVAVFEEPDPTKRPMYPKHLVYVGGRDMQLEELRAAMYWKRIEKEQEKAEQLEKSKESCSMISDESKTPRTRLIDYPLSSTSSSSDGCMMPKTTPHRPLIDYPLSSTGSSSDGCTMPKTTPRRPLIDYPPSSIGSSFDGSLMPKTTPHRALTDYPSSSTGSSSDGCMMSRTAPHRPLTDYHTSSTGSSSDGSTMLKTTPHLTGYASSSTGTSSDGSVEQATVLPKIPSNLPVDQPTSTLKTSNVSIDQPVMLKIEHETSQKNESADVDALVGLSERGSLPPLCSPSTSFTVNTRAAMNVIQQMWESPLSQQSTRRHKSAANFDDSLFKVPLDPARSTLDLSQKENSKPGRIPFPVFCDDGNQLSSSPRRRTLPEKLTFPIFCDENTQPEQYSRFQIFQDDQSSATNYDIQGKVSFPVFSDENKPQKASFPIFCDHEQPKSSPATRNEPEKLSFPVFYDQNPTPEKYSIPFIVPVNLADTPLEPENKENRPPKLYETPIERRPLSGILTPATDVPVQELNSEDSEEEDDDYCKVLRRRSSDFDDETCSTKAFAITLPSSTPFARPQSSSSRKSLIYNGSYICEDNSVKSNTEGSKYVNGQHLSLILENSKEQGSNSSGGGGSAVNK